MIADVEVNLIILFIFCLISGFYLLGCNLDFLKVLGIYYVEFQISLIDNLNVTDWPLNDTKFPFSFFNFKHMLEITSLLSIIYHCTPP